MKGSTKRKIEAEWVKLKYDETPNIMICERCKNTATAPMPCGFKEALSMMIAFYNIHKKCKEQYIAQVYQ